MSIFHTSNYSILNELLSTRLKNVSQTLRSCLSLDFVVSVHSILIHIFYIYSIQQENVPWTDQNRVFYASPKRHPAMGKPISIAVTCQGKEIKFFGLLWFNSIVVYLIFDAGEGCFQIDSNLYIIVFPLHFYKDFYYINTFNKYIVIEIQTKFLFLRNINLTVSRCLLYFGFGDNFYLCVCYTEQKIIIKLNILILSWSIFNNNIILESMINLILTLYLKYIVSPNLNTYSFILTI
ncbi:hypothetical protein AGLY_003784 [Aphis glycines]|uniref:Uncharacterized protein n=1 Tax=Aphis glycines TaxID=307491 RepID=A0A6G0TZ88_APHGL|nr:hypothetical protein AGLY_003784 [Aphis glycines]